MPCVGSIESYQRAQAVILLDDMSSRVRGNPDNVASYESTNIGTGDTQPADCSALGAGAARDVCEWSNLLKGAAETDSNTKVGAMIGARGCITLLQAADRTAGVCKPGIVQVAVAWQGLHATQAPSLDCGKNQFGDENYRRLISAQVLIPLLDCK